MNSAFKKGDLVRIRDTFNRTYCELNPECYGSIGVVSGVFETTYKPIYQVVWFGYVLSDEYSFTFRACDLELVCSDIKIY